MGVVIDAEDGVEVGPSSHGESRGFLLYEGVVIF